jgi:hypothetical protein
MTRVRTSTVLLLLAALVVALPGGALAGDEEAIRQAVLDYANSAYEVKPELVEKSVHPKLQKIGYVKRGDMAEYRELWMNFYELQELVAGWNKEGRFDAATARRDVKILDRLDQTAVARLDAEWGIDFFQLAKIDGTWTIMNVIWQSYPAESAAAEAPAE